MFCEAFETQEQAQSGFPSKQCETCDMHCFKDGIYTCSKILDNVMNKVENENEN